MTNRSLLKNLILLSSVLGGAGSLFPPNLLAMEKEQKKEQREFIAKVMKEADETMTTSELWRELYVLSAPNELEEKGRLLDLTLDRALDVSDGKNRYINGQTRSSLDFGVLRSISWDMDSIRNAGGTIKDEQKNKMKILLLKYAIKLLDQTNYGNVPVSAGLCYKSGDGVLAMSELDDTVGLINKYLEETDGRHIVKEILGRCSEHLQPFVNIMMPAWEINQRDTSGDKSALYEILRKLS